MVSASAISRLAERSHLVVMEIRVLVDKRGLKASNTVLQSRKIIPVGLLDLALGQRFDGCQFVGAKPDTEFVLVDRPHPAVAHLEGTSEPGHATLMVHRRPTSAGVLPHGHLCVDTHLATLGLGLKIQHFGKHSLYVSGRGDDGAFPRGLDDGISQARHAREAGTEPA